MQPPRNYQPLREEHARATQELTPQAEKQEAPSRKPDAQQEPEPTRPNQVRASSGRLADSGGMEAQQALANDLLKQSRADASTRHSTQPETAEQQSGKDRLAADLKEAKEGMATVNQERDAGHAQSAKGQQKHNAPAASEKLSGKERLTADFAEAKESAPVPEQGHDTGRSR